MEIGTITSVTALVGRLETATGKQVIVFDAAAFEFPWHFALAGATVHFSRRTNSDIQADAVFLSGDSLTRHLVEIALAGLSDGVELDLSALSMLQMFAQRQALRVDKIALQADKKVVSVYLVKAETLVISVVTRSERLHMMRIDAGTNNYTKICDAELGQSIDFVDGSWERETSQ